MGELIAAIVAFGAAFLFFPGGICTVRFGLDDSFDGRRRWWAVLLGVFYVALSLLFLWGAIDLLGRVGRT